MEEKQMLQLKKKAFKYNLFTAKDQAHYIALHSVQYQ
jgi:hypothetical protein